jgi:hypothetical protein
MTAKPRKPLLEKLTWAVLLLLAWSLLALPAILARFGHDEARPLPLRSAIIGKWIDAANEQRSLEFFADGSVFVSDLHSKRTFTYRFVDDDTIRLSDEHELDVELRGNLWLSVHFNRTKSPLFSAYDNGQETDFFRFPDESSD